MSLDLSITAIKRDASSIFDEKLKLPEPPTHFKDKIEALEKANLTKHRAVAIQDMRVWQAKTLGFKRVETDEVVSMLMGEPHTTRTEGERQNLEWAYNHHKDEILPNTWGSNVSQFIKKGRTVPWFWPPFADKVVWQVNIGKLNYLKRDIPYGVVLKINELKELKLFNCFQVAAPVQAWASKTDIDPIILGSIWELPPNEKGEYLTAGIEAHFFIAQW